MENTYSALNDQTIFDIQNIRPLIDEIINLNLNIDNLNAQIIKLNDTISDIKKDVSILVLQKIELQTQTRLLEEKIKDLEGRTLIEVVADKIDNYINK